MGATENEEIKTKPSKPTATEDGGGVTIKMLKKDYEDGIPLLPSDAGAERKPSDGTLHPASPQEVADYRNVDVYYVLKAVDPDFVSDPNIES